MEYMHMCFEKKKRGGEDGKGKESGGDIEF